MLLIVLIVLESNFLILVWFFLLLEKFFVGIIGRGFVCGGCIVGFIGRRVGVSIEGYIVIREDRGLLLLFEFSFEELICIVLVNVIFKICRI